MHPDPWESLDSPCGGSPSPSRSVFLHGSGVTRDNSVCRVSHEKVTTHGVKTSGVRALTGRSEL